MITKKTIIDGIQKHYIVFQQKNKDLKELVCKIGKIEFYFTGGEAMKLSEEDFMNRFSEGQIADMLLNVLKDVETAKKWGIDVVLYNYIENALREAERGNKDYILTKEKFAILGLDKRNDAYILYSEFNTESEAVHEAKRLMQFMYCGYLKRELHTGYFSPITSIIVLENLGQRDEKIVWSSPVKKETQTDYMLHGMNMVEDDSSLCAFAKSITKDIIADYEIVRKDTESDTDYYDRVIDAVSDRINNELCQTNIKYDDLMERYAEEIGRLLYDMENCGYQLECLNLSFFDNTNEVFNILLEKYIAIHYGELFEKNEK